jgi:methionine-R-sulfoxide reductase
MKRAQETTRGGRGNLGRQLVLVLMVAVIAAAVLWLSAGGHGRPAWAAGDAAATATATNVGAAPAPAPHTATGKEPWMTFTKPGDEELRSRLSKTQYEVTQHEGTEPPFRNEYWDNKREGIYVDVVSGEPLFSSREKYDSGTGWPSFYAPLEPGNLAERVDRKLWSTRTEVRSKHADSHLGHVFPDGPRPTGLRYCMNSAAMRFIPVEELEREGYGQYLAHFQQPARK